MPANPLTLLNVSLLLVFAVTLAAGQFMFRFAAQSASAITSLTGFVELLKTPWLWVALTLYGAATVLWIGLLQRVPLSLAYPFSALGFVIVPIGAWLFFHEPLTLRYGLGTALILCGLFVLSR
jgi:multidrug transporter EmrE-like cation transporter